MVAPAPAAATVGVEEFFTAAIGRALELGLAAPDDVLAHATPDVLAAHLPRSEWTKILAACLAAPRTDARVVLDTITVPVLCEHVPFPILWTCLAAIANRALGRGLVAPPPSISAVPPPPPRKSEPVIAPPPPVLQPVSPTEKTSEVAQLVPAPPPPPAPAAVAAPAPAPLAPAPAPLAPAPAPLAPAPAPPRDEPVTRVGRAPEPAPLGDPPVPPRLATAPGATSRSGVIGSRRPQAPASMSSRKADARTEPPAARRASTATDFDIEADLGEAWKKAGADEQVEDDQLVDWAQSEETMTSGDKLDRKR